MSDADINQLMPSGDDDAGSGGADADQTPDQTPGGPDAGAPGAAGDSPGGWRDVWQVPALAGAVVLLVSGMVFALSRTPEPRFDDVLDRAETLITRGRPQDAIDLLNDRSRGVYGWIERRPERVPPEVRQRYHQLIARGIYEGQRAMGIDFAANHESVIREYQRAEAAGATLGPKDLHHLAQTYATRMEYDLALSRAQAISDESRGLRDEVQQSVVESWIGSPVPRHDKAAELLTRMLTDPGLPAEDRAWALARRAEVQISQGFEEAAITGLLRALPGVEGAEGADAVDANTVAGLHLQLAKAYLKTGAYREADRRAARVLELANDEDPAAAQAMLIRAEVHEVRSELPQARDLYISVGQRFANSDAYAEALLGLGETESSIESYEDLREHLRVFPLTKTPTPEEIKDSLLARYLDRMAVGDHETALRFAAIAEALYPERDVPPEVTEAIADGHGASADVIEDASPAAPEEDSQDRLAMLDPSSQAEAQRHLIRSGAYYRDLAEQYVLSDNDKYADALWNAAVQFDRAGDLESAIRAYRDYAEGVPNDARRPEARYRLGRAYQAMGEYDMAAKEFEALIEDWRTGFGSRVGPFALRAYVPLAQCYLLDSDPENDSGSERLLLEAVSGSMGGIESPHYRDALVELGSMFYHRGEYPRAIERLTEAIERYPDDPDAEALRYRLADSQRLLAREIARSLDMPMPDSERRMREREAASLRGAAIDGFERVVASLRARDAGELNARERLHLRNSSFYLGDCAFDLGEYERAIRAYDEARERYPHDAASLVAMVQIVNAYIELGDLRRARTANERARRFYLSLPEEAWEDPNLPMGRDDWERWLDSSAMLYGVADG